MRTVTSSVSGAAYTVFYYDIPDATKSVIQTSPSDFMKGVVQGIIGGVQGTQVSDKTIKLAGLDAYQIISTEHVSSDNSDRKRQLTVVITDAKIYIITSVFLKDSYSQENADKFVNSFALTK